MIIREMNEGPKIPYVEDGTRVCLNDDLTLNLEARQKDWPVHIDICRDADGALVIGTGSGQYYVAQFDLPPKQYVDSEEPDSPPMPQPIDMDAVIFTLWSLDEPAAISE